MIGLMKGDIYPLQDYFNSNIIFSYFRGSDREKERDRLGVAVCIFATVMTSCDHVTLYGKQ